MPNLFRSGIGFAACLLCCASVASAAADTATITVQADQPGTPVNRLVFGHNIEAGDGFGIYSDKHSYYSSKTGDGIWNPETRTPVPAMLRDSKAIGTGLLRYPGGCLAHSFDWKATIGPVAFRPNFTFGLDEFLSYCKAVGAEPLITVSDYAGTPQDAADLVEYLNAPADAAHPWAQKRAANGHPAPYGVRYLEMGNETDHGNHQMVPARKFSAEEYIAYFTDRAAKMRAVDTTIRLGALMGTGTGPFDPWNGKVLTGLKSTVDYIIVHTYALHIENDAEATAAGGDLLMRTCLASNDQFEHSLAQYRAQIRKFTGKTLPLAITEYNASFVQENPVPYRFSYGAALFAADYLRVLLKPETHVLMANYWQFANGYWGMVQGNGSKNTPAFPLFRLWGEHFGSQWIPATVRGPRIAFEGYWKKSGILAAAPMQGDTYHSARPVTGENLLNTAPATLQTTLENQIKETYPVIAETIPAKGNTDYKISFEARFTGETSTNAGTRLGINVVDARGWDATHSGIAVEGAEKTAVWQTFSGTLHTLPDAKSLSVSWRLLPGQAPLSGTLAVRSLSLMAIQPETLPAYPAVTAAASRSRDGKIFYLIVFNKSTDKNMDTTIRLDGFKARSAKRWTVNGPSLEVTNQGSEKVQEVETGVTATLAEDGSLRHTSPAHSMTAIEFYR